MFVSSKVNFLFIFPLKSARLPSHGRWTSTTLSNVPRFRPSTSGRGLGFPFKTCIFIFSPD